jgi:hypothetical protein
VTANRPADVPALNSLPLKSDGTMVSEGTGNAVGGGAGIGALHRQQPQMSETAISETAHRKQFLDSEGLVKTIRIKLCVFNRKLFWRRDARPERTRQ